MAFMTTTRIKDVVSFIEVVVGWFDAIKLLLAYFTSLSKPF